MLDLYKHTDELCDLFLLFFSQRFQKCFRAYGFDVIGQLMADVTHLCQVTVVSMAMETFYGKSNFLLRLRFYV